MGFNITHTQEKPCAWGCSPSKLPEKYRESHEQHGHMLFAVPKKGRLHATLIDMIKGSGFSYTRKDRVDIATCKGLPITFVFLPAADIATYVGEGNVDLGITGEDIVAESGTNVDVIMQLGIGKCRLSVQAPVECSYIDASQLAGKRIVTSFPFLSEKYFSELEQPGGGKTSIKTIGGSVEAACGLGLADGIVDLVETGTTMRAAGLEEVAVLMETETVLIANPKTKQRDLIELVRKRFEGYLTAQRYVMVTYNVPRSKLELAEAVTPGKRSPTVNPLEDANWCSVSSLVDKKKIARVMDELEDLGATDILTTSLLSARSFA